MKILIIHTAFIGDIILSLPLISELKKQYPHSDIDYLTIPPSINLLENQPELNQVLVYDKHGQHRGPVATARFIGDLKSRGYQLAVIPHRSIRSAILAFAAGIPRRIGFDRSSGHFLMTDIVKRPLEIHEIDRNLSLLQPLGYSATSRVLPRLYFNAEDQRIVDSLIDDIKRPIAAIAPGSVWATKRWLPERFAEVILSLYTQGYQPVIIGGPADAQTAEVVQELSGNKALDAVGKMTLRQSAYLISKSRFLLTNDSAPLHLAVAVETPVVAIFGPTITSFGFYPYGENDLVVETEGLTCRPCGKHGGHRCPEGHFKCMGDISVRQVMLSISQRLATEQD